MNATTEQMLLETEVRDPNVKAKALRRMSRVPLEYYGFGKKNMHLSADYQTFRKLYIKAGGSTIIDLMVDGKKYPVLVHDIDFDPVTDEVRHVDVKFVDMDVEVTAEIKIEFVGVSPAVKNLGAALEVNKDRVEIKCLPKDLIHGIEVDISVLEELNSSIHVKDLKVPSTVQLTADPEETIAKVAIPRIVEEEPIVTEGAAEGAEGAEGEAAGEKKEGEGEGEGKKEEK